MKTSIIVWLGLGFSILFFGLLGLGWALKSSMLYIIAFSFMGLCIFGILTVVLINRFSKKKPEHEKRIRIKQGLPDVKDNPVAKNIAVRVIQEELAEEIAEPQFKITNEGMEGTEKSELFHFFGMGYYTQKFIYFILNTESTKYTVIVGESIIELMSSNRLQVAIQKLAENPEVHDIEEREILIDDFGNKIQKIKTTRQTKKQIEEKKEQVAEEEAEGL